MCLPSDLSKKVVACQSLCCKHIIDLWSIIRTSCNEFERKASRDREIERRSIWEIFSVFCCIDSWMMNHVLYTLVVRNILLTNPITNHNYSTILTIPIHLSLEPMIIDTDTKIYILFKFPIKLVYPKVGEWGEIFSLF